MKKSARAAQQVPTELHLEPFTLAYAEHKGLEDVKLTIDEQKHLRIVDLKGNELEIHDMSTHEGIQGFFSLVEESLNA